MAMELDVWGVPKPKSEESSEDEAGGREAEEGGHEAREFLVGLAFLGRCLDAGFEALAPVERTEQ